MSTIKKEEEKLKTNNAQVNNSNTSAPSAKVSTATAASNAPQKIISSGVNANVLNNHYNQQYGQNVQSQEVTDAWNDYTNIKNQRPSEFQSAYDSQLNDIYNKIMNREAFEYDLNADMLYQQAKDQYTALGKMAMQDTMGQASALTGGYGNSYANTAGYQAYQGYLQNLNENIPEYYQMAFDRYNQEGADMLNKYSMTKGLYDTEYGQHRDKVGDWYTDVNNAYNVYANKQNLDFNAFTNAQNLGYTAGMDDINYQYQVDRDAVEDAQWQKDYDLNKKQVDIQSEQWEMEKEERSKAVDAATEVAKSTGVLSASELQKFEEYLEEGNIDGISRHLDSMVAGGVLDEGYAAYVLSLFLPDEEVDTSMKPSTGPSAPMGAKRLAKTQVDGTIKATYGWR